jgi:hypothetical protein
MQSLYSNENQEKHNKKWIIAISNNKPLVKEFIESLDWTLSPSLQKKFDE